MPIDASMSTRVGHCGADCMQYVLEIGRCGADCMEYGLKLTNVA